ncbi:hypothetical protein TNCV_4066431 [Trichonephila clavipes]|uniref:Uncharacterized protein n=1 Tax=Trichonephila clavipes TaxID=2585209 RepID=A0A8X7BGL0_TRICX|nr:hypothetical protein TNCV_4066431 [Trichonephila clavipes]
MRLQKQKETVDGYEWRCRNQSKDNRHDVVRSCENLLCEKLFLWETAPSLDSFSKAGQPNSSKVSSQPARRCVRGPGGSNCVVPPQGENEENKSFVATSFLKNKTRTVLLSSVQCFLRDKYGL